MIYQEILNSIRLLHNRFDEIPLERKTLLEHFSEYISNLVRINSDVNLIFICTHNSRRSHMAQIWAKTAAEFFGVPKLNSYSGGTESTEFNQNAVKAVVSAGFKVNKEQEAVNPKYFVSYSNDNDPIVCFSKIYNDKFNPQKDFAAVMTCSDADENCPIIYGANERFSINYNDPKEFDNTAICEEKYLERFFHIGMEMLYVFSKLK